MPKRKVVVNGKAVIPSRKFNVVKEKRMTKHEVKQLIRAKQTGAK